MFCGLLFRNDVMMIDECVVCVCGEQSSYDSAVIGIFIVDSITVGFFVIDYLIRFTSSPLKLWFLVSLYNIFDLCVIIPYFVQVGLEGSSGTSGLKGLNFSFFCPHAHKFGTLQMRASSAFSMFSNYFVL